MFPGISTLGEFFTTPMAGMQSFPRVDHKMLCESTLTLEGLPTVAARIRLPTIQVQLPMLPQGRWIPELLGTNRAFQRLFSRVDPLVCDETASGSEVLVA